jgi:hypothetical protein
MIDAIHEAKNKFLMDTHLFRHRSCQYHKNTQGVISNALNNTGSLKFIVYFNVHSTTVTANNVILYVNSKAIWNNIDESEIFSPQRACIDPNMGHVNTTENR